MKQRLQVFLCFFSQLLISYLSLSQPSYKKDSIFVFSLLTKADDHFTQAQYDSALYYSDKAEIYSKQKNFKHGAAWSLIKKTEIFIDKDELNKADAYPKQINQLGQQINDSLIIAVSIMQMAQIKMYDNKTDEAITLFEKCTKNYFDSHPSTYAALAFNDYGYACGIKGELLKKADNLIKALKMYEIASPDDYGELGATLNNLSTVYYELNNKEKAIEYAKRSIIFREKSGDISRLALGCCNISQMYRGINNEEAVRYQQLCVKYGLQSGDEARIIHSYTTSALIASDQNDTKKAIEYELKAIALLEKNNKNQAMLARRYISVGMGSATLKEDSSTTIGYFNKAEELSKLISDKFNLRDVYLQLASFYKKHNDFAKAYDLYSKHIIYRDSIIKNNTASSIADLEKKYQTEKKDKEIIELNTAQRIKELQIEKQNALLAGNLLEAKKKEDEIELLSKAKELQELRITQQDEQLEKQMLVAKTNEQQLQLAEKEKQLQERKLKNSETTRNFILAGIGLLGLLAYFLFNRYQLKRKIQEQDALLTVRNNIAKDLHDEIGSTLTSIKILSEVSEKNLYKDQTKTSSFLQKITEQSSAAQQGISDIVWAVKPENDKLENMVIRIREYVSQTLESKNITTIINIDEQVLHKTLDMSQRRDFLLIFREAVNNIAKYAAASKVQIQLEKNNNDLLLKISDNGKGFDTTQITSSNGLKNMRSRAAALKGTLNIESENANGTTITLTIPTT
ncbi:tetratricopeptide repeat-containing sensor histidine kinase [Ferruginibacter sp.]|nr:tetratricopeptide repeat protein [Ferruginibacter sp.]